MKFMKIPNKAVLALMIVFVIIGLVAIPLAEYPWRLLQFAMILAIGFILNMIGGVGAGDAKFAAAMAPFVAPGDARLIIILFAAVLLASFATHRTFKRLSFFRARTTDWLSWEKYDFPMGLALAGTFIFYLLLGAVFGV